MGKKSAKNIGACKPEKLLNRTLGPVAELEQHLPADWWKNLFNSLYLKTDGDVVENAENTCSEIDLVLKISGLKPWQRVLDMCCGQGRHSLELARRGFQHISGIDRSRYLIRLARKRARQKNFPIDFHEGDARHLRRFQNPFYCILIMGNSFGYFDSREEDLRVLQNTFQSLEPGGVLILDITDGDWMRKNFENRSWEWIDQNYFVCRERELSRDSQRLISREVISHAEKGIITDQFYAEHLYSRQDIEKLMTKAGFKNITLFDNFNAESTRGQDLGMMAHRLFISGQKPAAIAPRVNGRERLKNIAVLLGDPQLPDPVKKNGRFNQEDFEAVDKLKAALSEMEEFKFSYIDRHRELHHHLMRVRPDFIFNLCDEGFGNQPEQELHIPAMLETLDLPYSGSGPHNLALCTDKRMVNSLANAMEIPVPEETVVAAGATSASLPSVFPALIKPVRGDGSFGITAESFVTSGEELMARISTLRAQLGSRPLLVQEFLPGKEYSLALLGNPKTGFTILPPLEVDYSELDSSLPQILCYESKWLPDSPWWKQIQYRKACLSETTYRQLVDWSISLFETLDCRDYARFDFRCDSLNKPKLLEVNPNPGWCWDGKLNLMASFNQMTYTDLLRVILNIAIERISSGNPDC